MPHNLLPAHTNIVDAHPLRDLWVEDEQRQRASYLATRRHLVPFLVPHRFEGNEGMDPEELRRSRYGYGIPLNRAWLDELMGHVRGTPARYSWGSLSEGDDEQTERPEGGIAKQLWDDATLDGTTLSNLFEGKVLTWLLSSLGGFVLVDTPPVEAQTQREERERGKRPYFRWIPMSWVVDYGTDLFGFRWVEILESEDGREPDGDGETEALTILYQRDMQGNVTAQRKKDGEPNGPPIELGQILDPQGRPFLPLVPAFYGEHPDIPHVGSGLLAGLDDIVVDLFNRLSETVEAFRDAAFVVFAHKGGNDNEVREYFANGSRLIHLGDDDNAELQRIAGDSSEVDAGLKLIELGIKAWALGAKRKSAEAMESADARSGVSLKAEFQVDARPLLVAISEKLDEVETNALFVAAQMAGLSPEQAADIAVVRDTDFQLEDEASRIARIAGEFLANLPLPSEAVVAITMRWIEASNLLDLNEDGVRERVEAEVRELASAEQTNRIRRSEALSGFGQAFPALPRERDEDAAA